MKKAVSVLAEVVLIDVTEQPIEQPKRGKRNGILERKSVMQSKL